MIWRGLSPDRRADENYRLCCGKDITKDQAIEMREYEMTIVAYAKNGRTEKKLSVSMLDKGDGLKIWMW